LRDGRRSNNDRRNAITMLNSNTSRRGRQKNRDPEHTPSNPTAVNLLTQGKSISSFCMVQVSDSHARPIILSQLTSKSDNAIVLTDTQRNVLRTNKLIDPNWILLDSQSTIHRVVLDTAKDNAFLVYLSDHKYVCFRQSSNGLYYFDTASLPRRPPSQRSIGTTKGVAMIQTIDELKRRLSKADLKAAEQAWKLRNIIGCPPHDQFRSIIMRGVITDCPVTTRDVDNAFYVYKESPAVCQGRTTRTQPKAVKLPDFQPLSPQIMSKYKSICLAIDLFFVNSLVYFTTISRHVRARSVDKLANRTQASLKRSLQKVILEYSKRGFHVTTVLSDNEFSCLDGYLRERAITLNLAAPNEHVPEIERSIRTIKERVRTILSGMSFATVPNVLLHAAICSAVRWLNYLPNDSIPGGLSPHVLMTGRQINFKVHCALETGSYCQVF